MTSAPAASAYRRIPWTELWLSWSSVKREPSVNGNDSPTSFSAAEAFAVNTTVYWSGSALKKRNTSRRAFSTMLVAAHEVGFSECGFPRTWRSRKSSCCRSCDSA